MKTQDYKSAAMEDASSFNLLIAQTEAQHRQQKAFVRSIKDQRA